MPAVILSPLEPDAAAASRLPEHIRRALSVHQSAPRPDRLVAANDGAVTRNVGGSFRGAAR